MRLGRAIRMIRAADNVDQKTVAAQIGIVPSMLSRIESGKECSMTTLVLILKWLLEDDEQKVIEMVAPSRALEAEDVS